MKAATLFLAFALAGCATVSPAEPGPTAGVGQVAYTNGLRVRPVAVVEDSRCPVDVQCVWAGRLVVRSEVIGGSWKRTIDLQLGKPEQVADGALTLVAVEPQKKAEVAADPRYYRFTFRFDGGL